MAAFSFDKEPMSIACPTCGKQIKKTVAWFKRDQDCPHGCRTHFKSDQFRRQISDCERKLADTMRKLSKTINIKFKL